MKTGNYYSRAFSLFELIIASAVISIIMLGILTTMNALQKDTKSFSGGYYVNQQTNNILNHMATAASLAFGSPNDPGIVGVSNFDGGAGNWLVVGGLGSDPFTADKTFCIHQNVSQGDTNWPGTVDTNVERWLCYTAPQGTNGDYNVYWCSRNSAGACLTTDRVIGKARSVIPILSLDGTPGNSRNSFQVTIQSCYENTPTCNQNPANTSADNPYYSGSRFIFLSGHSAG